jgi:hypothetical protein
MNKALEILTTKAIINAYGHLISTTGSNELDDKELETFRDQVREKIGIKDLFMYYIFYPTAFLFICEFDTPEKLTSEKLEKLLDYLDLYEHRKLESKNELFLIFNMGGWLQ